jgi:dTDP-4-amino-4,6-dideoxygalactose transaminase
VPAHTYIASALAVVHAGATPVLVDVDDGTGQIDVDAAAAAIGPRTTAVMPVHLYGQLCDMRALQRLTARHGIALVEDAAQAHGATWDGHPAGGFGAGGAFSFYPSKNLGALGDAGALCTNDDRVAERARQLRNLGQRQKGEHMVVGYNDRLDGLQAAFLSAKLARLDSGNAIRRMHARTYREVLDGSVALLHERPATPCVYHLFPVRIAGRRAVAGALRRAGIATGVHYSPALHRQPALAGLTAVPDPPRRAEAWADSELSLPMSPALTRDEIHRAADACASAVAEAVESGTAAERELEHV